MRLNVGCGYDIRKGWTNIDTGEAWWNSDMDVTYGDALHLESYYRRCEVVLLNHVLHLFDYDEAEKVLLECFLCLKPGGRFVVIDADVERVTRRVAAHKQDTREMLASVMPGCATDGERLLRWIVWHGTRRSLWSDEGIANRMRDLGMRPFFYGHDVSNVVDGLLSDIFTEQAGSDHLGGHPPIPRPLESFCVIGVR